MDGSEFATLESILQILRAEGFYAAEAALKRELEDRYEAEYDARNDRNEDVQDDGRISSVGVSQGEHREDIGIIARPDREGTVPSGAHSAEFIADTGRHTDLSRHQSEQLKESGILEGASRRVTAERAESAVSSTYDPHLYNGSPEGFWSEQDVDEYDNDFDVGYVREYVRGQALFAQTELASSGDQRSSAGLKLYHQAQQSQHSQEGSQGHSPQGGSQQGNWRASSQLSAGTSQARQSARSHSHVSNSSHGRSSTSKAPSEIMLMGAVNATAPQNMLPLVVPPLIDPARDPSFQVSSAVNSRRTSEDRPSHFSPAQPSRPPDNPVESVKPRVETLLQPSDEPLYQDESLPQTPVHRTAGVIDSPCPPSGGPASYALSNISSEYCLESPLVHEPSLGRHLGFANATDLASCLDEAEGFKETPSEGTGTTATTTEPVQHSITAQNPPGGHWPLNIIGSVGGALGTLGKVFGRGGSQNIASEAQPEKHMEKAIVQPLTPGSPIVETSCQSLRDLCMAEPKVPTLILPDHLLETIPSPSEDTLLSASKDFTQRASLSSPHEEAGQDDDERRSLPKTPSLSIQAVTDNGSTPNADSAFSFAVTPVSEAPPATEPGRVFGTWPSFDSGHSGKRRVKGEDFSRKSSDYAHSGYSTDEGLLSTGDNERMFSMGEHDLSGPPSTIGQPSRPNSRNEVFGGPSPEGIPEPMFHPFNSTDYSGVDYEKQSPLRQDRSQDNLTPDTPGREDSEDQTLNQSKAISAQKPYLGPVPPLNTSISLPNKGGLELIQHKEATRSMDYVPPYDTLAAYKPEDHKNEEELQEEAALTSRTHDTVGNTDGSSGPPPDDYSSVVHIWDKEHLQRKYEIFDLKIIHRRRRTGFEESKDISLNVDDLVAGRYQVTDFLGSAAFSQAVQAIDIKNNALVCLKIIKNNKDYLDQSLDEIKLLKYVNEHDPDDTSGILQLYDYFYYKEHLFLVCELLRANLYEFQKYNQEHGNRPYFVLPRVQAIAKQVLHSLAFMHSLDLIHCDLKPENILIKSYSKCLVKVIDLGSSCFTTDHLSSYVQSRSYRSPEVILGLPYSQKVDIWSLGCILAELLSGFVLLQTESMSTLLTRLEGILGPVPESMLRDGRYTHRYYTIHGFHYEMNEKTERYEILRPKHTSLRHRVPQADQGCLDFLQYLLSIDPVKRPTAEEALQHPWLRHDYNFDFAS